MGTQIMVAVDNDDPRVGPKLEKVRAWFEDWEQALSRFRPDSELSQLNASAGKPFGASSVLWEILQTALTAHRESGGLVSPAMLPALELAGYRQSFELIAESSAGFNSSPKPFSLELSEIQLNPKTRGINLPIGMRLDFGGIAKGWAAHQTVQRLQDLGAVLADVGGDIAVSIPSGQTQGWAIDVKDPLEPGGILETVTLTHGGVATSGRDRRRWTQGGRHQHHVIDPRTALPAETDVLTATVTAASAMEAEMAAKAVLILGSQLGLEWLAKRPGCNGLVVQEEGNVIYGHNFEKQKDMNGTR